MKVEDIFSELPELETERMILRKLKPEDEEDIFEYCSDKEISKYTVFDSHTSIDDTRLFLNRVFDKYHRHDVAPWGIEDKLSGRIIGTTGFISWDTKNSKAELGYALSRNYWNSGYMTEAVTRIISFGFDHMKLVRVEARCHPNNIGSARVMEKSGMLLEGILRKHILAKGVYEDVKMYAITIDDYQG